MFCLFFKLSPTAPVLPTASQIHQKFMGLSDKDLKTCHFTTSRSKPLFFFSRKVNLADTMLLLSVHVSNYIAKSIRPVCRDQNWTLLLITIQMIKKYSFNSIKLLYTSNTWLTSILKHRLLMQIRKTTLNVNRRCSFLDAQFKVTPCSKSKSYTAEGSFPHLVISTDLSSSRKMDLGSQPHCKGSAHTYLLDLGLQVP